MNSAQSLPSPDVEGYFRKLMSDRYVSSHEKLSFTHCGPVVKTLTADSHLEAGDKPPIADVDRCLAEERQSSHFVNAKDESYKEASEILTLVQRKLEIAKSHSSKAEARALVAEAEALDNQRKLEAGSQLILQVKDIAYQAQLRAHRAESYLDYFLTNLLSFFRENISASFDTRNHVSELDLSPLQISYLRP